MEKVVVSCLILAILFTSILVGLAIAGLLAIVLQKILDKFFLLESVFQNWKSTRVLEVLGQISYWLIRIIQNSERVD